MATLNDVSSWTVSVLRGGRGMRVRWPGARQPERELEVYEFEACPFCRKVREVLSELDLSFLCHPCARGSRNRERVRELGGRLMFPFLVDPNTGKQMYESEDIISYLLATYGPGRSGLSRALAPVNSLTSGLASLVRSRGRRVQAGARPAARPLALYNVEASPYCRKVREALNELDLDFHCRNVAKGSPRRPELVARGGKMMVPYLIDDNTGTSLYESDEIVAYLRRTYG
jgi:glutathione S-transferase